MRNNFLYAGIDVSKLKLDIAFTLNGEKIIKHRVVSNDFKGFNTIRELSENLLKAKSLDKVHYVIESTGIYSEDIFEYLSEQVNSIVSIINPRQSKSFAISDNIRTKTDKVDAILLAKYCYEKRPKESKKTPKTLKKLRSLSRHLDFFIKQRALLSGHLESVKDVFIADSINNMISKFNEEIKKIEQEIDKIIKTDDELNRKSKLLLSIPGVGNKLSVTFLTEMMQTDEEKISTKVQSAHAGLSPRHKQSGKHTGYSSICRAGNSRLRKALFMPALTAIKYNPLIRNFYLRLLDAGKRKMVAITACMRKLLCLMVGVLNSHQKFDPDWVEKRKFSQEGELARPCVSG
jgi:transposase